MDPRYPEYERAERFHTRYLIGLAVVTVILLLAMALLWGPIVRPWSQERKGMANLAQAQFENQIRAERASAEEEAASLRAAAIAIVGEMARTYPEYREQEFIGAFASALENGTVGQTFYIPTEGSIPVLPSATRER